MGNMGCITVLLRFVFMAIKTLVWPPSAKEWRLAWMAFVFPVFFVGGFGCLVAFGLWLLRAPWWVISGWLFYMWVIEPLAYLLTPSGEALQKKQAHWIEHGD
jgi:hypothetical protein